LDLDPYDSDWDWLEIAKRNRDIQKLAIRLGNGSTWNGSFTDKSPFNRLGPYPVDVGVMDEGSQVVATLTTPGAETPENIIVVPVTRMERFEPTQVADAIAAPQMADLTELYRCGSLVFSWNTLPTAPDWVMPGWEFDDFRSTLVRALLRWAMCRDGVRLAELAARSPRESHRCVVHKSPDGRAYRFTVRHPAGTQFSGAMIWVLRDLGYTVVHHPSSLLKTRTRPSGTHRRTKNI
jgi:hypothetical protein